MGDSQAVANVTRCSMSLIRGAGSMSAIEITRQDLSISQLRAEAARTADAKQARRILAIAMVLDEHPRLLAAQAGGMDRQTLRDWVHRYNADGLAGLARKSARHQAFANWPAAIADVRRRIRELENRLPSAMTASNRIELQKLKEFLQTTGGRDRV